MPAQRVLLDEFVTSGLATSTELSSVALGGRIIAVSDEFFAEAFHLLLVQPAPSLKGQFGLRGALFSGWESRRHNPTYDWAIIKLGTPGKVIGFDVDTAHFNGNEAPEVSVEALYSDAPGEPAVDDTRWVEVLERTEMGPSSRHLFKIPETTTCNYIKLNMYPDGGIARFRVYGSVTPVLPANPLEKFDLVHVFAGGRVEFTSDQHFGVGSNLIIPGRGKDMGDGWETKRSRGKGHKDWAIIRLGAPGYLAQAEIDTAHFKGNFPYAVELHGLYHPEPVDWTTAQEQDWTSMLTLTKLGPHRQHYFQLENVQGKQYTHVKMTIWPDGGVKRVRIVGTLGETTLGSSTAIAATTSNPSSVDYAPAVPSPTMTRVIPVLPLTPEAFAPFGKVIQEYADHNAAPRGTYITSANQGSASKFHKLALLESSYPADINATTGISVYSCKATEVVDNKVPLTIMERHPCTNQAFVPMAAEKDVPAYLVVVAQNGSDDKPDIDTVRAFFATGNQSILYHANQWHQPMTALKAISFACIETQVGDGNKLDCEIVQVESRILELP